MMPPNVMHNNNYSTAPPMPSTNTPGAASGPSSNTPISSNDGDERGAAAANADAPGASADAGNDENRPGNKSPERIFHIEA